MHPLNRVYFAIQHLEGTEQCFNTAAKIILQWLRTRPYVKEPGAIPESLQALDCLEVGKGVTVETIFPTETETPAWGLKFTHPDRENRWLRWVTEITLLDDGAGSVRYSNTLGIGRIGEYVAPVFRPATNPAVNRELLSKLEGKTSYGFRLMAKPVVLQNSLKEVSNFLKILESRERTHPIVYVTPTTAGEYIVDYKRMASDLAGMAHVVVASDPDTTFQVGTLLPQRLNCFDGGLRIYWPGFRRHSEPAEHPLFLRWRLDDLGKSPGHYFIQRIAETAAFSNPRKYANWSDLEAMRFKTAVAKAKSEGNTDEMLALFEEDNHRQNEALKKAEEEISRLTGQLATEKGRSEQLAIALRYKQQPEEAPAEASEMELITSVADALDLAEINFSKQLIIALNGQSDRNTPFAKPEEVMQALSWLATTWLDAKSGREPNPRLDLDFKETLPGWDFRSSQPEVLAKSKKFKEWYRTKLPDGRSIDIGPHLAYGVSKDPRECIRIAFNWDSQSGKVVIGYIGQHQKNQNT